MGREGTGGWYSEKEIFNDLGRSLFCARSSREKGPRSRVTQSPRGRREVRILTITEERKHSTTYDKGIKK